MLRKGDTVTIVHSNDLAELELEELVGKEAIVTCIVRKGHRVRGVYLVPMAGRYKRQEWFVPIQSIKSKAAIDRMRSEQILQQTKL